MALIILRIVFLMVASAVGFRLIQSDLLSGDNPWLPWIGFGSVLALAVVVIAGDAMVRRKRVDTISAVYFGMIIGLFLTYVLKLALSPILPEPDSAASLPFSSSPAKGRMQSLGGGEDKK